MRKATKQLVAGKSLNHINWVEDKSAIILFLSLISILEFLLVSFLCEIKTFLLGSSTPITSPNMGVPSE